MRPFSLAELVTPLQGSLVDADADFSGVSTDSRSIRPGDLFVALSGANFDGHQFVADVAADGAVAALVVKEVEAALPMLRVPDTLQALGQLGALNRRYFEGELIAITGSCGKTTVKNLLLGILKAQASTLAADGNFNNEIGVPLTLLRLQPRHRYAVVEMGAAAAGDVDYLCRLAEPTISVLLNAMPAHLQGFGSVDQVARAKGEIFEALAGQGTAVINADSPWLSRWLRQAGAASRLLFGFSATAEVSADDVLVRESGSTFQLRTPRGGARVELGLPGRHNISNALAAAAVATALGIETAAIAASLSAAQALPGRLQRISLAGGISLLDDSYNANPGSVRAAIDVLAAQSPRRWLVLGAMAELGPDSDSLHAEIGSYARECGIEHCWVCGEEARPVAVGFGASARCYGDRDSLVAALAPLLTAGDVLLIKGSRSAAMDKVVTALRRARAEEG